MDLNTIRLGDCISLMKEYPDKYFDLVVTDPPYGIGINKMNYVVSGAVRSGVALRTDFSQLKTDWDDAGLTSEYWDEMRRISKNQIIFGANNFANILPNSRCWLVWDKRINDKFSNDFSDCELIWTSFDEPCRIIRFLYSGMMQDNMKHKEKRVHPTQKPLKIMRDIINKFSKENDLILDPFCGSASTLIAAQQLNRRFIGIEVNEDMFKIANKRLAPYMTQKRLENY